MAKKLMLSSHFSLDEMQYSETALKLGISNEAPLHCVTNLTLLCTQLLEPIREAFDRPVYVTSGYRCREVNSAVGGVSNSLHLSGRAADITSSALDELKFVVSDLIFRGIIKPREHINYPTFIHVAI